MRRTIGTEHENLGFKQRWLVDRREGEARPRTGARQHAALQSRAADVREQHDERHASLGNHAEAGRRRRGRHAAGSHLGLHRAVRAADQPGGWRDHARCRLHVRIADRSSVAQRADCSLPAMPRTACRRFWGRACARASAMHANLAWKLAAVCNGLPATSSQHLRGRASPARHRIHARCHRGGQVRTDERSGASCAAVCARCAVTPRRSRRPILRSGPGLSARYGEGRAWPPVPAASHRWAVCSTTTSVIRSRSWHEASSFAHRNPWRASYPRAQTRDRCPTSTRSARPL